MPNVNSQGTETANSVFSAKILTESERDTMLLSHLSLDIN